jgi:hypothetical protein
MKNLAINSRSVNVNYCGLPYTFSAVRALQVLLFTIESEFDPHSLPPLFNDLQTCKSLANQLGFGKAI